MRYFVMQRALGSLWINTSMVTVDEHIGPTSCLILHICYTPKGAYFPCGCCSFPHIPRNEQSINELCFSSMKTKATSCARGDTICLRPCKLTISSHLFDRWHLFRHIGYLGHQKQVDLWPFDLESGVRVTCDVGYLCANFILPRPLCSRVRPDVRDRQTSDRRQMSDRCQTSDKSIA